MGIRCKNRGGIRCKRNHVQAAPTRFIITLEVSPPSTVRKRPPQRYRSASGPPHTASIRYSTAGLRPQRLSLSLYCQRGSGRSASLSIGSG